MSGAEHTANGPSSFPLQELLGISIDVVEEGRACTAVEADASALNPNGVVHGAVLFAIADTAMAAATTSIISEDMACASIDVHVRSLRPAGHGWLEAETVVLMAGRRVVHLQARMIDGEESRWRWQRVLSASARSDRLALLPIRLTDEADRTH